MRSNATMTTAQTPGRATRQACSSRLSRGGSRGWRVGSLLLLSALPVLGQTRPLPPINTYTIVAFDDQIEFANTNTSDVGWVEAMNLPGTVLDTAWFRIEVADPVVVLWKTGSDVVNPAAGGAAMPLEVAARVSGHGSWDYGVFDTTPSGWTSWSDWTPSNRPARAVVVEGQQSFGIEMKARVLRNGVGDSPGTYTQPQRLEVSISPAPWLVP